MPLTYETIFEKNATFPTCSRGCGFPRLNPRDRQVRYERSYYERRAKRVGKLQKRCILQSELFCFIQIPKGTMIVRIDANWYLFLSATVRH